MKKLILLGALSVLFYAVPGYTSSVFGPFGDLVHETSREMKDKAKNAAKNKFQEIKDNIMSKVVERVEP